MESAHTPYAAHPGGLPEKQALAIDPALGSVYVCTACGDIHLQFTNLHVRVDVSGFHDLVVLLNRAAANFELWAEHRRAA